MEYSSNSNSNHHHQPGQPNTLSTAVTTGGAYGAESFTPFSSGYNFEPPPPYSELPPNEKTAIIQQPQTTYSYVQLPPSQVTEVPYDNAIRIEIVSYPYI